MRQAKGAQIRRRIRHGASGRRGRGGDGDNCSAQAAIWINRHGDGHRHNCKAIVVIQLLNVRLAQRHVEDIGFVKQPLQADLAIALSRSATANPELSARSNGVGPLIRHPWIQSAINIQQLGRAIPGERDMVPLAVVNGGGCLFPT